MLKLIFLLLAVLMTFQQTKASEFTSTIHSIVFGRKGQEHLVKFDNGRVVFVPYRDKKLIESLRTIKNNQRSITVRQDSKNLFLSGQVLEHSLRKTEEIHQTIRTSYVPTVLENNESAKEIMANMRSDYNKVGECSSRAHVWAFEEFQRSGLQSMKLFLFFTERYIRNYRFQWWFHVAPMTYVQKTSRVLDKRYASRPLLTKTWTDIFIKSKRQCRWVKFYKTYALNQESQDCYLISTSMHFHIPRDIEKRDLMGEIKESFMKWDIERSYRDAFNIDFKLPGDPEEPENTDNLK